MVLGMEEAKKVLAKHPELMAFFIYSDESGEMKEWMTEGMEKLIVGN
jgi:thiamine biosynthesis lipoprotein